MNNMKVIDFKIIWIYVLFLFVYEKVSVILFLYFLKFSSAGTVKIT